MKRAILIFGFLVGFCGNANAFDEWSDADIWREVAVIGLLAADWNQTHHIAVDSYSKICVTVEQPEDPNLNAATYYRTSTYYRKEINPILGDRPSPSDVDKYFAASIAIHIAIAHVLPTEYRPYWQYLYIINEAGFVAHNIGLGISMGF